MLSAVSVFDSRTANVHVENTNDLAYTPLPPRILAGLSGKTKQEAVEKLAGVTAEEETRLQTLTTDLASDPARTVRQLQSQEARIKSAIEQLERLVAAATDETRAALRDAHTHLATARSAAAAASANLFADEPLPDIGSDVWKALWEAARDYSRASAYPDRPFPVTEIGAHCVLCQQPLRGSLEAAQQLRGFRTGREQAP